MNIVFISECHKSALENTRFILDQFALRAGTRTWITSLSLQGLDTVHNLLKKNARKNSCVICYSFFGKTYKLQFIVGTKSKINEYNSVPTQCSSSSILRCSDSHYPLYQAIALLARISGLFHDYGKASISFQKKLTSTKNTDAIRHEFLSALYIYLIALDKTDEEFVDSLERMCTDKVCNISKLNINNKIIIKKLKSQLAQSLIFLVISHHFLPHSEELQADDIDMIFSKEMCGIRYSLCYILRNKKQKIEDEIDLDKYNLFKSEAFCSKLLAAIIKLKHSYTKIAPYFGIEHFYVLNLARICLIISDHTYSSQPSSDILHDKKYKAVANIKKGEINQYLDNHVCEVSNRAYLLARQIQSLRENLPSIKKFNAIKKLSTGKFAWQNKAIRATEAYSKQSNEIGFFGLNVASTGTGKTITNAKIMCAISSFTHSRLTYTLGLRSLTLQTGNALKEKLLLKDLITIKVGSNAVSEIEKNRQYAGSNSSIIGSDLLEDYDADLVGHNIHSLNSNYVLDTLNKSCAKEHLKTLASPILVSTIDYIIKASQEYKGGKHIISTLRILTSELIIDEVDEYNIEDYINIYMLVYYAGLYGSRVIISSATANSIFTKFLFKAYVDGRAVFNKSNSIQTTQTILGIYSENTIDVAMIEYDDFSVKYRDTINCHINFLLAKTNLKTKGEIINIDTKLNNIDTEFTTESLFATLILEYTEKTAKKIFSSNNSIEISTCLVRFANIEPLIKISKEFIEKIETNQKILYHICIYHSRYTVKDRSKIESVLDDIMNRKNDIFTNKYIEQLIKNNQNYKKHVIIVFSSPVEEVGRDHDYDFALIEPSSYRSIVQIAGRVQRHRENIVANSNIFIFQYNYKKLESIINNNQMNRYFYNPGFEIGKFSRYVNLYLTLSSHNLYNILNEDLIKNINNSYIINDINLTNIRENISDKKDMISNFTLLEHCSINDLLTDFDYKFSNSTFKVLTGYFQNSYIFRSTRGAIDYSGYINAKNNEENCTFYYHEKDLQKSLHIDIIDDSALFSHNKKYLLDEYKYTLFIENEEILNEINFKSGKNPAELNLKYSNIFGLTY